MRQYLLLITVIGFILILPLMAANDYIIIVNKKTEAESISQSNIQNIFLGKKTRWSDGIKTVPVNLKAGKTHQLFIEELIKKSTNAYINYWRKMIFTGKGVMPVSFKTETEVVDYIGRTEGAIGYISSPDLLKNTEEVKIISLSD